MLQNSTRKFSWKQNFNGNLLYRTLFTTVFFLIEDGLECIFFLSISEYFGVLGFPAPRCVAARS